MDFKRVGRHRNWKEKNDDLSFAKQQLGSQQNESKVLGLPWDRDMDKLTANFPNSEATATKREVLRNLANMCDPLGLATPLTLQGKLMYREICNHKVPWAAQLIKQLKRVGGWEGGKLGTESANRSYRATSCGTLQRANCGHIAARLPWHKHTGSRCRCLRCDTATNWNNATFSRS